ncbi:hypothetical protein L596_025601 [Steinernema carpocapsae]|uniref:Uncharacterized protein n=1 Tax=Steinernema carpocapsae TaxID=34508 RepID=A0A4U5M8F7_STECR|nr:hypothetical protein L596_025601 [Steinernema carpocapsae]
MPEKRLSYHPIKKASLHLHLAKNAERNEPRRRDDDRRGKANRKPLKPSASNTSGFFLSHSAAANSAQLDYCSAFDYNHRSVVEGGSEGRSCS